MPHIDLDRVDDLLRRAGVSSVSAKQAVAALLVATACVLVCAWRFWPRTPEEEFRAAAPEAVQAAAPSVAAEGGASVPSSATIVVHVVGAVKRPGVYSLPAGSRVGDALEAAGGTLGSAAPEALNLARLLADGEQVALPTQDEWRTLRESGGAGDPSAGAGGSAGGAAVGAASGASSAAGKVNINTADEAALDALPGVGPSTAKRIVEERAANGPFTKPEDLLRVTGIGPKKFDGLKDLVTVQ